MFVQKTETFLLTSGKYFEGYQLEHVAEKLNNLDDAKWMRVYSLPLKDPMQITMISMLGGSLGIDRFILGDVGLGILKLLTCGGFGIWTIIDWFMIAGTTRERNMEKFQAVFY